MYIAGIDPGLSGGIAIAKLQVANKSFCFDNWTIKKLPITKHKNANGIINVKALHTLLDLNEPFKERIEVRVFIEHVVLRPGNKGNLTMATNYGRILAVLEMLGCIVYVVPPRTWQGAIEEICSDEVKWRNGEDPKKVAFRACQELFRGETDLFLPPGHKRTPSDGVIDALLIAR